MLYRFLILFLCCGCSIRPLYDTSQNSRKAKAENFEYGKSNIHLNMIAERYGQKLYGYLADLIRDLELRGTRGPYRLAINLSKNDVPYALDSGGDAQRLRVIFTAKVILRDRDGTIMLDTPITASITRNTASVSGDVLLSMYGSANDAPIKELALRIIENIKVVLQNEDRI